MNIEKTIEAFKHNRFEVSYFEASEAAARYLDEQINGTTVGFGDSATLLKMNLFERLSSHNAVVDPQHCVAGKSFLETAKECLTTDIFLTSVNAFSETGELINIDGTGNRVAGSLFGHKKVYFVFGTNKGAATFEAAMWRARNIAGPLNAKRKGLKTPCAKKGDRCYDCSSPERICNGVIVYYKKIKNMDMEIILINEDLGF